MIENQSITEMSHMIITELSPAPFDELALVTNTGDYQFISYDMFRRLYNDAVESMYAYMRLADDYQLKYEAEHELADSLQQSIIELTDAVE